MSDTGRAKGGGKKKDGERLVDALEAEIYDPQRCCIRSEAASC